MADKQPETAASADSTAKDNQETAPPAADDIVQPQKISSILRAVLEDEMQAPENNGGKKFRYPWFIDVALGMGLLLAVGGFSLGLFKMYISHKAQQCIIQGNYPAAIGLLKGNPFVSLMGTRDEDPEELLARALYLDAMHKMTEENDITGGMEELQHIHKGTHEFDQAQKILLENFVPSETQLTGGVVQNEHNSAASSK